jgi:uncharacterized Fe-S center protein
MAARAARCDVCNFEPYFHKDKCPDEATASPIRESCPYGAIVDDRSDHPPVPATFQCNQCMRCQEVANGALEIKRSNFMAFLEVVNISASLVLSTFEPGNKVFINLATDMTPVCDCFGFTSLPILPDAGVFGSDDIVAVEQAMLDMTAKTPIIEENLPGMMEIVEREGHPWQWIHGPYKDPYGMLEHAESLGMGSRAYELVDVLPFKEPDFKQIVYIPSAPV